MAWNPSPKVAVARDAARKLAANRVVIVYTTDAGEIGMASYGESKSLCAESGKLGDKLYEVARDAFYLGIEP